MVQKRGTKSAKSFDNVFVFSSSNNNKFFPLSFFSIIVRYLIFKKLC